MSPPTARVAFVAALTTALLAPGASLAETARDDAPPDAAFASAPPAEEARYVPRERATEMRSTGAVVGGAVLMSLGGLLTVGGAVMIADTPANSYAAVMTDLVGGVTLSHGIASLLVGIPLTAWGATSVPSEPEQASAVPAVAVGATSASARWTF